MIHAKDILGNKGLFMMMNMVLIMMYIMVSDHFGMSMHICVVTHSSLFKISASGG
jgi:hypothetical protein